MNAHLHFHHPEPGGTTFDLVEDGISIGRNAENMLQVDDPSVSGLHAELTRVEGGFRITDRGSTNGTWVNDSKVSAQKLQDGDKIRFGEALAIYRDPSPVSATPLISAPSRRPFFKLTRLSKSVRRGLNRAGLSRRTIGVGAGVAFLLAIMVVASCWSGSSSQDAADANMVAGISVLVTQKLSEDLNGGKRPVAALEKSVATLEEYSESPEFKRSPRHVQKAFSRYLESMRAWSHMAYLIPENDNDRQLLGFVNAMKAAQGEGNIDIMGEWNSSAARARQAQEDLVEAARRRSAH